MAEVTKTKVSKNEISSEIDLNLPANIKSSTANRIKDEVGDFLIDFILEQVSKSRSPIEGEGKFTALDPKYRKIKQKAGRGGKANLEFSGSMLDALDKKRTSDGVKVQIKGDQAPKADGHNNFSGKSQLKTRQFLPKEGQLFRKSAQKEIDSIIADAVVSTTKVKTSQIKDIGSKSELRTALDELFPSLTRKEAQDAILVDEELRTLFNELNLLRFFSG